MTRLLLIFDPSTFLTLDIPMPSSLLADAINQGQWAYPQPLDQMFTKKHLTAFRAVALGSWVFATCDQGVLPKVPPAAESLSPRQVEILNLLSEGLINKQIANRLQLSPRTVNFHIAAMKKKLGTQTIAQSVSRGSALGYCRQTLSKTTD